MADASDTKPLLTDPSAVTQPAKSDATLKSIGSDPPESKSPVKKVEPNRPKRILVDEMRERHIQVNYSTVTFRPGQYLDSEHMIALAKAYGVAIREA